MNDKPDHRTNKKDKSKMQDWDGLRGALTARVGEFAELNPDVMRGIKIIENSPEQTGKLDAKVRSLIALAVAVTTRCDGCISVHSKRAVDAGASREEIAEALGVAIWLNAGAAVTYTARVFDAVDGLSAA